MKNMRVIFCVVYAVIFTPVALASEQMLDHVPGAVFQDCTECPQMVVVPPGQQVIGSTPSETQTEGVPDDLAATERPAHTVIIRQVFAASATEVTHAQYGAFVQETGYPDGDRCFVWDLTANTWNNRDGITWRDPGFAQTDTHPVVCVSWTDAVAYTDWLSAKTGQRYRLLSEAAWEYAARAGTTTPRYWAGARDHACAHGNVNDLSRAAANAALSRAASEVFHCEDGHRFTAPVATFTPNAFGLYDMIGNVWEWTADCFTANYDSASQDGAPRLDGDCTQRMNRGGSWADPPWRTRAAMREWDPPHGRYAQTGFRVARDLD